MFSVMEKGLRQSHAFKHGIRNGLRQIMLLLNEDVEARDISGFMTASGRNCSSKEKFLVQQVQ